jgi:hypothetical protein
MSTPSEAYVSAALHAENVAVNATPEQLQPIVARGPRGALAVAGLAVAVLLAIWLLFFFVVFVPWGAVG